VRRKCFGAVSVLAAFCLSALASPIAVAGPGDYSETSGQAAAWIARQLAENDGVIVSGGSTDWGSTIDALLGLIASKWEGHQVAQTAEKVYASDTAYIGLEIEKESSWPAIAKMLLALKTAVANPPFLSADLDATAFPTSEGARDLIADLLGVLNPDGSFGDAGTDSIFVHPLAMLALAKTAGGVPASTVDWLDQERCSDMSSENFGSFGWAPDCSMPDSDSTALIIQALIAANYTGEMLEAAEKWLLSQQDSSGGFTSWGATNTNTTGLAAQALLTHYPDAAAAAAEFIADLQITCVTIMSVTLDNNDLGAIAYDEVAYDKAEMEGMDPGLKTQFLRATVQAVLGLGAPNLALLTFNSAGDVMPMKCPPLEGPIDVPQPPPADIGTGGVAVSGWAWLPMVLIMSGLLIAHQLRVRA